MKHIVIIGCGPAGLLAAYAGYQRGYRPIILGGADPKPSVIHGAQYLHTPIKGLVDPEDAFSVRYTKVGSGRVYASKIYGPSFPEEETSWYKFEEGDHEAWPLQLVYERLWSLMQDSIFPLEARPGNLQAFLSLNNYQKIFNTAPLNIIVPDMQFTSETVQILSGECLPDVGANEIVYYGTRETQAYRSSNIQGYCSIEYPANAALTGPAVSVTKPVSAAGTVPAGLYLLGRYGSWKKGVLVDDAYRAAGRFLDNLDRETVRPK